MDGMASQISTDDIKGLPDHEKRDLERFIQAESQKATIQASIHSLTDMCFKKCITSRITQGTLDRNEESCMQNCVDRFMDANGLVLKHLDHLRGTS